MPTLELTVLGSGTSMGVPTLGCHCSVCESADANDKRLRPSILLSYNGKNVVIDTTPDFRTQAIAAHLDRLDAILYTHSHADHIFGLDDIRPYNLKQKAAIPIYASDATLKVLQRSFAYIFDEAPTASSLPGVELHTINGPFTLFGATITPVPAMHGPGTVLGFRLGNVAYLTDFSTMAESSKQSLRGLESFHSGRAAIHAAPDAFECRAVARARERT